ncbi:MAG: glycine cleavage system protein GcvH [Candidatus Bathyarchaeota archaeon]|nr:glycine cleavage system protein GcvH [Candidatus Bathyarchaeota archaeon]
MYYSRDWIWVKREGDKVRIGITDYAQKQLKDVVFAELPKSGDKIVKGQAFGMLESVKSVSELIAPVSGRVEQVNNKVLDKPEILNEDPYGEGWLLIVSPTNLEEDLKSLMNFEESVKWHRDLAKGS